MHSMTKLEIINETVSYYGEDTARRGVDTDLTGIPTCMYLSGNGNKCAIGRCFNDKGIDELGRKKGGIESVISNLIYESENRAESTERRTAILNQYLEPRYRGHQLTFWSGLQNLHDHEGYWDTDGLTLKGRQAAAALRKIWS